MIKKTLLMTLFVLPLIGENGGSFLFAQRPANASGYLYGGAHDAVVVPFEADADINNYTIPAAPLNWGLDTAWDSEDNVTRGTNHIGKDVLNIGRVSFQPSDLVDADGNLSAAQRAALQSRLNHIAISGVKDIVLNCDHEALNATNYKGKTAEWYKMIKATVLYCRSKGFNVITVSPFNEPDYTAWNQGTKGNFAAIAKRIYEDPDLKGIRISAGNTLNCDEALSWYNYMKPYVSEGNTHQLAGSFDNYAKFWERVRSDGNHATADELHNVGEAFIGAHYGLQSGIWWGYDGAARGQYCRASVYGKEIGYAENRSSWTAATVYKRQDGRTDAFVGSSERQANTSSFDFLSTDRPVFFDGYGPAYSYTMLMPGGTGYQTGQVNGERMIQIHRGEDVPLEPLNGVYAIMNVNSSKVLGYYNGANQAGLNITQATYTTKAAKHQQWRVDPVSDRIGGDYSYFFLRSNRDTTHLMDVKNWSTSAGTNIIAYPGGGGALEQWFAEYAGNGNWYIRSRHSGLYLEIKDASTAGNGQLVQNVFSGSKNQQWRFIPIDAKHEQTAPSAPQGLAAEAMEAAVKLSWQKNSETDVAGYLVLRALATADPADSLSWDMIGRMVSGTEFIDNSALEGVQYAYKVKAVDKARNQSPASDIITATYSHTPEWTILKAQYCMEGNTLDTTAYVRDAVVVGKAAYAADCKQGGASLVLNDKYLMLPPTIADNRTLTVAMWAQVENLSTAWQRLFDFGNGTDQYFFLTPNNGSEMRVVLKNKGDEQILSASKPTIGWHHFAVVLSADSVMLYVDGALAASTDAITLRPADFHPRRNFIGRSQFPSDPLFKGNVDDVRIYSTPLSAGQVVAAMQGETITGIDSPKLNADGIDDAANGRMWLLNGTPATGNEPKGTILVKGNRKVIK